VSSIHLVFSDRGVYVPSETQQPIAIMFPPSRFEYIHRDTDISSIPDNIIRSRIDIMAPFINQVDILSAQAQSTSGRSTPSGGVQKMPRVVKNKATDLADKGTAPWDDTQRQILVDNHALFDTWEPVAKMLGRSNQAYRSEWNKMKNGQREKEGNWQEKVEVCEAHRKTVFSSKRSGARNTITTAPAANVPVIDSSGTSSKTISTSRSPYAKTSSNTSVDDSPDVEIRGKSKPPRGKAKKVEPLGPPEGLLLHEITADLYAMGILSRRITRKSFSRRYERA
jgi:hypothetical protein